MNKIDHKLLEKLQNLSMIEIKNDNKEQIIEDLNRFLEFVDILEDLDLSTYDATYNPIESYAPLREDKQVCNSQIGKKILENAPKSDNNFFIVPKIIE